MLRDASNFPFDVHTVGTTDRVILKHLVFMHKSQEQVGFLVTLSSQIRWEEDCVKSHYFGTTFCK